MRVNYKNFGSVLFDIFNYSLLILFCVTILFPLWDTLVLSFSDVKTATSLGIKLWPGKFVFDSYAYAFRYQNVFMGYANTIFRTVAGTSLGVFFCMLAAYPLSKKNLIFRNFITIYFLITMFFGGGLIPTYILIRNLGLVDNRLVYIIPGAVNVFHTLIIRNYMMTLDPGLEESAYIDGAGYFTILIKIIVPVSKPVLATVALWQAVSHWNAWFDALIYIRSDNKTVMQILLRRMLDMARHLQADIAMMEMQFEMIPITVRAAMTIITLGPIVLVYPFAQKYFIRGIVMGAFKG